MRVLMFLAVAVLSASVAKADYLNEVLADNPVAYWRMNDTSGPQMTDYMGGNHGVYGQGVVLGQAGAQIGTGTSVALGTGAIQVADSSALDLGGSGAVEGWFYLPDASYAINEDYCLMIRGGDAISYGINLSPRAAGLQIRFWVDGDGAWGPSHYVGVGSTARSTDAWYHVVGEWNAAGSGTNAIDATHLYVNGVDCTPNAAENTGYPNAFNSSDPLKMGGSITTGGFFAMPGSTRFDELAIYSTPIGLARAAAHYDAAFVPEPSTVVMLLSGVMGLLAYAWRKRK